MSIKFLRKLLRSAAELGWAITIQPADGSKTCVSAWHAKGKQSFALVDSDPIKALARVAICIKSPPL